MKADLGKEKSKHPTDNIPKQWRTSSQRLLKKSAASCWLGVTGTLVSSKALWIMSFVLPRWWCPVLAHTNKLYVAAPSNGKRTWHARLRHHSCDISRDTRSCLPSFYLRAPDRRTPNAPNARPLMRSRSATPDSLLGRVRVRTVFFAQLFLPYFLIWLKMTWTGNKQLFPFSHFSSLNRII